MTRAPQYPWYPSGLADHAMPSGSAPIGGRDLLAR
jgi:hypothetical protein